MPTLRHKLAAAVVVVNAGDGSGAQTMTSDMFRQQLLAGTAEGASRGPASEFTELHPEIQQMLLTMARERQAGQQAAQQRAVHPPEDAQRDMSRAQAQQLTGAILRAAKGPSDLLDYGQVAPVSLQSNSVGGATTLPAMLAADAFLGSSKDDQKTREMLMMLLAGLNSSAQ